MCGIFGYALRSPLPLSMAFKVLELLEVHQYPHEPKPVGGYGAGVAILSKDGKVILEKVGKVEGSPAHYLSHVVKVREASVLVGHVRMPSPEFMGTAVFRETAQPYLAKCYGNLTIVSAHNGKVTNYMEIMESLDKNHVFESEAVGLIDSEVIPHLFEKLCREKASVLEALDIFFATLDGNNTLSLLQITKDNMFLHFLHKGKTRGLRVWTNDVGEVIFCSRNEPLMQVFSDVILKGNFSEKAAIPYNEDASLKLSLPIKFWQPQK
ncbi:MAG: hypothetical protein QW667_06765 [Candidatus Bathyarchaeia archaeon]